MIGIDLVKIDRISRIRKRFGDAGVGKFLTPNELASRTTDEQIAGAWAAKEAVSKALGCGIGSKLTFHDIEITKNSLGMPKAILSQRASNLHGIRDIMLSISHEKEYAVAVAMIPR